MARSILLTLLAIGALAASAAPALGRAPAAAPVALPAGAVVASANADAWATVNICDTPESPNALGIRASMPGTESAHRLFMRFTAQYWSSERDDWVTVDGEGISPWVRAGSGVTEGEQTGWTFRFDQPPVGVTFTMRGLVELEWRKPRGQASRKRTGKAGRRSAKRVRGGATKTTRRGARPDRRKRQAAGKRGRASQWITVRRRVRVTETGILGVQGGDPADTSKAMCLLY